MKTKDLAWLAGIVEGEGCFSDSKGSPGIEVQMTDADIVARVATMFGVTRRAPWTPKRADGRTYKPVYGAKACGTRAIGWMMTIYPMLGERRQSKVREILQRWRESPRTPRAPRGQRFMAMCHPSEVRSAHGLCHRCYMLQWRANRRLAVA